MGSLVCHWRQGQDEPLKILTKKCGSLVCHWQCWAMAARTRKAPQDCAEELGTWWLLAMLGQGHLGSPSRLCRRIGERVVAGNVGPGPPKYPLHDEEMWVPLFAIGVAARTRRTTLQDYEEFGSPCPIGEVARTRRTSPLRR